jgi:hypothetical protein
MKKLALFGCYALCLLVMIGGTGCGKKGDPVVPPVPQPLPVQDVSAALADNAVHLSWTLPQAYNTGKPLDMKHIKHVTVFRKTELEADNQWDFSRTREGWTAAGKTFPIKLHQGTLRAASEQNTLLLMSPPKLSITAEQTPYLKLRLWSKHSRRGYIVFTTEADQQWDTDVNLQFQPAVHTSFYAYQRTFNTLKVRAFRLAAPDRTHPAPETAHDYVIDMKRVPSWKGTVTQIGVMLQNDAPGQVTGEMGLDRVELAPAQEPRAPVYEMPPWLFLEDEEGWHTHQPGVVFGAARGALYGQGTETLVLLSPAGQTIARSRLSEIRLRMKVTAGNDAYLMLRYASDPPFRDGTDLTSLLATSPDVFRIPLADTTDFHTYTLKLKPIEDEQKQAQDDAPQPDGNEAEETETPPQPAENDAETPQPAEDDAETPRTLSQLALIFPETSSFPQREILIDYVHVLETGAEFTEQLQADLTQRTIPPIRTLEHQVQQQLSRSAPGFEIPYTDLEAEEGQAANKPIKLAEFSPTNPEPATIMDDTVFFTDTRDVQAESGTAAALQFGQRYTYTIKLTDRRNRTSDQPASVTVKYTRPPTAPHNLRADAGDGKVVLFWARPFLTADGFKIRALDGYQIFRSVEAEQSGLSALQQVAAGTTTFTDAAVTNGATYSYAVQTIAPAAPDTYTARFASQAAATPLDTIAPEPPTGLVGVYLDNQVKLYWHGAQTPDFAGFHLYRSQDPAGEFRRLNPTPILQASYQDAAIEPQQTYYYYVTAFDDADPANESEPSDVIPVQTVTLD